MSNFAAKWTWDNGTIFKLAWKLGFVIANKINHHRIFHALLGYFLDKSWDCGRKYHASNFFIGTFLLDLLDIVLETHVKHTVAFIKDKVLNFREVELVGINNVDKSSWSAYQ